MRLAFAIVLVTFGVAAGVAVHQRHDVYHPAVPVPRLHAPTAADVLSTSPHAAYTAQVWEWQDPAALLIVGLTVAAGVALTRHAADR